MSNIFEKYAKQWWKADGSYNVLHYINPLRIEFILDNIANISQDNQGAGSILDIGCGGGIASKALAENGFSVTGIDEVANNVQEAKTYASIEGYTDYIHSDLSLYAAECLASNKEFNHVCLLEVLEHVEDYDCAIRDAVSMLKPGGLIFISTINRNLKSWLLAKICAEYILRWVPYGMHQFSKFLKPSEVAASLEQYGCKLISMRGIQYDLMPELLPISVIDGIYKFKDIFFDVLNSERWKLSEDVSVNYIMCAQKH